MTTTPTAKVLSGNCLVTGRVVYLGHATNHFVDKIEHARLATNEADVAALEKAAVATTAANLVVDAHLVEVRVDRSGRPHPVHIRERLRSAGPSIVIQSDYGGDEATPAGLSLRG